MAITLSSDDYDDLWQQANPQNHMAKQEGEYEVRSQGHSERVSLVPEQLGQGYIQEIQWRGINVMLFNYQLHDDVFVTYKAQETEDRYHEVGFNLSGNRSNKRTGESFIEWGNDASDVWTDKTYANDPIRKIDIHVGASESIFQTVTETINTLPKEVSQQVEDSIEVNAITPQMHVALDQLLHCPFHGKTKQLYFESKCLELIALKLEQLQTRDCTAKRSHFLKPDDVERIHLAKRILTQDLEHPPSLKTLARQANLNDYKLKVGFRQVFGTTVFGYLHQCRMVQAQRLLAEQRLNVKEISRMVGYVNQSQFAAAFRKQFGINPKAYMLSKRL